MSSGRNTPRILEEGEDATLHLPEEPPMTDIDLQHELETRKINSRLGQEKEERRQRHGKRRHDTGQRKGEHRTITGKEEQIFRHGKEEENEAKEKGVRRLIKEEQGIGNEEPKEKGELDCCHLPRTSEISLKEFESEGDIKRRGEGEAETRVKQEELLREHLKIFLGQGEAKLGKGQHVAEITVGRVDTEVCQREQEGLVVLPKDEGEVHKGSELLPEDMVKVDLEEEKVDAVMGQVIMDGGLVQGETQEGCEQQILQTDVVQGEEEQSMIKGRKTKQVLQEEKESHGRRRGILSRLWERATNHAHVRERETIQSLSDDILAIIWARWRTENVLRM